MDAQADLESSLGAYLFCCFFHVLAHNILIVFLEQYSIGIVGYRLHRGISLMVMKDDIGKKATCIDVMISWHMDHIVIEKQFPKHICIQAPEPSPANKLILII